MDFSKLSHIYNKFKFGEDKFYELMQNRIKNILLVADFFDAFILEQDGQLSDLVYGEYLQMNLSTAPKITNVATCENALPKIEKEEYDLIVISMRVSSSESFLLGEKIKLKFPEIPVLLLLNKDSYIQVVDEHCPENLCFDDVFLWNGDAKVFVAMIKSIEDRINIENDVINASVGVLLLVENSIKYYSLLLPILYQQIFQNNQQLVDSELNDMNKRLRMRARPKVIMVHTYDEAIYYYNKYKEQIMGVITNANLMKNGEYHIYAGISLIEHIREENPYLPILMQSSDDYNEFLLKNLQADFIGKFSDNLISVIREFLAKNLGYGQFTFCNLVGEKICAVKSIQQFIEVIKEISIYTLKYHLHQKHFSAWLTAKGEFKSAKIMRDLEALVEYPEDIRNTILKIVKSIRSKQNKGKLINFSQEQIYDGERIVRLANGSLGGKGRGIAFLNALMASMSDEFRFEDLEVKLPRTAIIGTDEFDLFLERNNIIEKISFHMSDEEILRIFASGSISKDLVEKIIFLIEFSKFPLAIRSSGLLEDSQSQPFAGVYQTFMIANRGEKELVLETVLKAIKLVFASPFLKNARNYIESINYKLDQEKMAVIIQEIVGEELLENYFFPHVSGVIQSHNYYPSTFFNAEDGIVSLAIGLGKTIVEGEKNYLYSPSKPQIDALTPKQIVEQNQRKFYALNLKSDNKDLCEGEDVTLEKLRISKKLKEDKLRLLTSIWDYENNEFIDTNFKSGSRVITYRQLLKYKNHSFNKIITELMRLGEISMGVPVEMEFSVNFSKKIFYPLQIRPMTVNEKAINIEVDEFLQKDIILYTENSMGNGIYENILDIVFIDNDKYDTTKTLEMKKEIEEINQSMNNLQKQYILIGPGRWGSSDRFLGVPVKWANINQAKIIVESRLANYNVEASQGSHFFHNLISMNVGYLTFPLANKKSFINWDLLERNITKSNYKYFKIAKFKDSLVVKLDGRKRKAIITSSS